MDPFIARLFKPLPVELRVTQQLVQPVYNSNDVSGDYFCGKKLVVCRELKSSSTRPIQWQKLTGGLFLSGAVVSDRESLLETFPLNDLKRPIPEDAGIVNVWMLMGYLKEIGPNDVPIVAMKNIVINKEKYIGYWGNISQLGWRLYLIRTETPSFFLRNMVNNALWLFERKKATE